VSEYLLNVHGLPPGRKGEGVTRVIYENFNGLQSALSKNEKLDKTRQVINDLQADVVCYNEHRQNLKQKTNQNGFCQMFNGGETELRAIAAHNVNKDAGKFQEGGTAMLVFGDLIEQFDLEGLGQDDLGLGRWAFMKFSGGNGVVTQVICGYSPCSNKKKDSGTVYQQHRRYLINKLNVLMCPRQRFLEDLLQQIRQWWAAGEHLVLCLDANENIYRAELGWQLMDLHSLDMKEVVRDFTGRQLGATFFRGSEPIDAIWATSDLEVAHACVMPVGYGVGDHSLFVVDFSTALMIGTCPPKIICPALRRLNTKIPECALQYSRALQKNILRHQLLERMIPMAESDGRRRRYWKSLINLTKKENST
jgi:hypothetical protein